VTGIAEAAMMAASAGGRPFAVATTTPDLMAAIERTARAYGHHDAFLGVCVPKQARNNPTELMRDPERLVAALREACADAMELGAAAIIIGGGPLAEAAISLQGIVAVPIIQPIPAAVALALDRAAAMQPARDG
jgi:Asp/Glu/hydantoin racemase